jgi:phosphoribosylformylglycinamidine synthase
MHFKTPGRRIILLGGFGQPTVEEFGSTQYAKVVLDQLWGNPPKLDMNYEKRVQSTIRELVRAGAVESAHDLSDGGLAVALAECSFGSANVGADVTLASDIPAALLLFHEGPSRILVSTATPELVHSAAKKNAVQALDIGVTLEAGLLIRDAQGILIDCKVDLARNLWDTGLVNLLHQPVLV